MQIFWRRGPKVRFSARAEPAALHKPLFCLTPDMIELGLLRHIQLSQQKANISVPTHASRRPNGMFIAATSH